MPASLPAFLPAFLPPCLPACLPAFLPACLPAWLLRCMKGRIVAVSIADTACAKSRPLGAKVYEALRRLGAATDMPAIEYRQAWALIG